MSEIDELIIKYGKLISFRFKEREPKEIIFMSFDEMYKVYLALECYYQLLFCQTLIESGINDEHRTKIERIVAKLKTTALILGNKHMSQDVLTKGIKLSSGDEDIIKSVSEKMDIVSFAFARFKLAKKIYEKRIKMNGTFNPSEKNAFYQKLDDLEREFKDKLGNVDNPNELVDFEKRLKALLPEDDRIYLDDPKKYAEFMGFSRNKKREEPNKRNSFYNELERLSFELNHLSSESDNKHNDVPKKDSNQSFVKPSINTKWNFILLSQEEEKLILDFLTHMAYYDRIDRMISLDGMKLYLDFRNNPLDKQIQEQFISKVKEAMNKIKNNANASFVGYALEPYIIDIGSKDKNGNVYYDVAVNNIKNRIRELNDGDNTFETMVNNNLYVLFDNYCELSVAKKKEKKKSA